MHGTMSTTTTTTFGGQLHTTSAGAAAAVATVFIAASHPVHYDGGDGHNGVLGTCGVALPCVKPDILLNTDYGLFAVYRFVKNFIG